MHTRFQSAKLLSRNLQFNSLTELELRRGVEQLIPLSWLYVN
jgi:hypothetical protein